MRKHSQKTRKNYIITLFTALFYRLWDFVSAQKRHLSTHSLFVVLLLAFVTISVSVFAQNEHAFRPQEESLHVFPSIVESTSWHNIQTLGMQDLDEDSLFQNFNTTNSAYINPDGTLPTEININSLTEPSEDVDSEFNYSPEVDVDTVESASPEDEIAEPVSSSSAPVSDTADSTVISDELDVPVDEDSTEAESVPEILDAQDLPIEETIETSEPEEEEQGIEEVIVSFFKRVTGVFDFAQSATTSSVSDEVFEDLEPEIVPVVPEEAVASSTELDFVFETDNSTQDVVEEVEPESNSTTTSATTSDVVIVATEDEADSNVNQEYKLTLKDFGVPDLESGQFINNLQLRLSLAGQYDIDASSSIPSLSVVYSFGDFAGEAGDVLFEEEISNALNGGYYIIPLPSVTDVSLLSDLEITITFNGEIKRLKALYIDSVWLEVGTVVYDKELLKKRYAPDQLSHLASPKNMEFLGDRLDFKRDESPQFSLRYNSQRNFAVRAVRDVLGRDLAYVKSVKFRVGLSNEIGVTPDITVTPEGLITVLFTDEDREKLKPGTYTVEFEINEGGKVFTDSFEFQWGLLSINSNQTEYSKDDLVNISMGALTPNGNTLCNANLNLYVTDPRGFISKVPVLQSGLCDGNNVVDVPDYSGQFIADAVGEYEMYLERLDDSGNVISHTGDTFRVVKKQEFVIERNGPTRIFPPSPYVMELTVHTSDNSFSGTVVERVPRDFDIFNTDAKIVRYADFTELIWDVSLLAGTSETVSYEFDAPDISPYLYELGPAALVDDEVGSSSKGTQFLEHRQWQIASDATGSMIIFWDDGASVPSGWTCLSCGSGTFFQKFVRGDSTYNTTSGTSTHAHTATTSLLVSASANSENFSSGSVAGVSHPHTLSPTIATASNLPEYRQLRVLQYNSAGEPPSLPSGAIVVFDDTVPTGWTQYSAQDGKYAYGEDTPATTGGSNEHTHSISGTTGAATGVSYGARGGGSSVNAATAAHTHTISTTTATSSNQPAYVEVIFGKVSSATSTPINMISMWTDTPPVGWSNLSAQSGDPFYQKFIKASTSYGSTGGLDSHSESDVTGIQSSVPSATAVARSGSVGASDTHTHVVNMVDFSTENNLPPYLTAIFAKRLGTNAAYDQLSYRWYANENAETPTDPWAAGGVIDLVEGAPIDVSSVPVSNGDIVRLRLNAVVSNSTSTVGTDDFKLQYGEGGSCGSVSWNDVGSATSSVIWRGYNNASVSDGVTLSSTTLASSTIKASYVEENPTATVPNEIGIGGVGEWDFVIGQNGANAGVNYCFRMVKSDGESLLKYTKYPLLITNNKPDAPDLSILFDNEKVASTTPWLEFDSVDDESNDVEYQIQIDDDYNFGSTFVDEVSDVSTNFENLVTPADKSPYNNGELMRFVPSSALSNGTTYWWRVRARDINDSNEWSDWATQRSFTIDTSLTAAAWFQTTEEQFDTDTLSDLDAVASDQVELATGSTTGSFISPSIDFDDGTLGTAWGSLEWNDTETAGDIKYKLEYYTTLDVWESIPDVDLPSNSTGFDTSPVNLLDLDTTSYNEIRIVADFTDSGGTPSLQDLTLSWGYRVAIPTITKLFSNEKTGTTTPTLEFTTTDPQGDDLTYQVQWSASYDFTASTTRTSDTDAGFSNITTGISDTDPFISGDTIQFTVQGVDALTDGSTYWWRVRAKDPLDADVFSFWTTQRAFTVATDTVVSTWFQTTDDQFDTDILAGTQTFGSDSLRVATTASEALIVYGEGVVQTPRYRSWNGTDWTSEGSLLSIGAPVNWVVGAAGVTREEYIFATVGSDGDVNAQVYAIGIWRDQQEITTTVGDVNARGVDVTYETLSGDAMVVSCDGDPDPTYYIWNGSTWTLGGTINLASTNNCSWIQLASDPLSDEIIVLSRDSTGGQYEAQVWNGSSWGNPTTQGSITNAAHEGMALAYEESGGQAVIVTSDGNPARMRWDSWNGTAWNGAATQGLGDDFEWGDLVADVGSDEMALCYQDEDTDIGMVRWTGSAWAGQIELEAAGNAKTDPAFACVFEDSGSRDNYIMTAYSDTAATNYSYWNNSIWSTESQIQSIGDASTMQLRRTGVGTVLGSFFDDVNDTLYFSSWDGTAWATTTTIENDMSVGSTPFGHPYSIAERNPGSAGTVAESPPIHFEHGVGPYWDEVSWNDTEPGTSEILYQIEYQTAPDTWLLISDSDIPGNSVGTSTTPMDLSSLSIVTHDILRIRATLSCDGSGNCPEINDWTLKWAEGISLSGNIYQYDQVSSTTVGSVAVAVNGVLQIGKTGSISGGTWLISNVTAFPGDVVTAFVDGASDANEAVGVTLYDGLGDITGLTLFERHLTLGSDSSTSTPLTNADVAMYNVSNDEDLFIGLSGSTLDVCATTGCSDAELYINTEGRFTPGGDVVTHDIEINGILVATTTLFVDGSWDNNATTTMTGSSVVFEATSTSETVDETGANNPLFNNVTFGTTTGNATWTPVTSLDIEGDLIVERGTLARSALPITVAGDLINGVSGVWTGIGTTTFDGSGTSNWADQNGTLQNVGNVLIDGSLKNIVLSGNVSAQSITIESDDILDASVTDYDITVYDNWLNNNTFIARGGEVLFAATTTGKFITAGSGDFYDLSFTGVGGSWSFTEGVLTVNNDFTVATGTVTMPTATTTLAGSFSSSGGTFVHNNSAIEFTSSGSETITANGTAFTNAFYNLSFNGFGSWTFTDVNATTSNDILIPSGAVTFPSGTLTIGGTLRDIGGSFISNSGTVKLTSTAAETLQAGGSSFGGLTTAGSGSWEFFDADVTISGDLTVSSGTITLPSGTLSLGGSLSNSSTITHNNGEISFDSLDSGETIDVGLSDLYDVNFDGENGGWTMTESATTTNNFTLATSSSFTLSATKVLSVGNVFTNSVNGASTTWAGSTLSLDSGTAYSINTKLDSGDSYGVLSIAANTDISAWNSSATTYSIDSIGSLYSQDHSGTDGALYIFGSYPRTSGTEYWSYATDFDGVDLSGGSERLVDVRFASGASTIISDSTIEILGSTTASTTIRNQGSGTYTISVTSGTTSAQYYDFDDLGSSGVSLLSSNIVTSLADGSFEVAVAAGTALTVSSTTIDANAGLQIYRVDFATTTAISANNVTQSDGTPASYWWFRESTGNLDGESFDSDTGDPGSIRWDDSSLVLTFAGTVYTDDGATQLTGGTCDGISTPVRVVVENGSTYNGSCSNVDGSYSIGGIVAVGDPTITIFLNGAIGGEKAVVVTKTPTADVTDADIYVDRVIVRHEDVVALSIDDMAAYDSSDDADIQFTAATGTTDVLTVTPDTELHVWATTTFTPNGTVTLNSGGTGNSYDGSLHIANGATFTGSGTTTYSVGGILTLGSGATFVPASSTVLMTATTSGKAITTESSETLALNKLQFTGSGGAWNINGNISATDDIDITTGTVTGTGNITLTNGSLSGNGLLSLGGGTTTIAVSNTLGGTQTWTFNNLILGNGAIVGTTTPSGTATTTVGGFLKIDTAHFLDSGNTNWNLSGVGTVFIEDGTFLEDTSSVTYSGVTATDILATDYYNLTLDAVAGSPTYTALGVGIQVFGDLSVGVAGTTTTNMDINDPVLNVDGDITIGSYGTFVASDNASTTIAGSYDNNGIFTGSGGTLTFDGSGVHTISAGNSNFSLVTIDGTGDFTVDENATSTSAWTLASANDFTVNSGISLAVGGAFTNNVGGIDTVWTGSTLNLYGGGNYEMNPKTVSDSYAVLNVSSNTDIRMWNSDASTTSVSASGSIYSMDHSDIAGDLYIYGNYPGNGSTDYWSYATDFDGLVLGGGSRKADVYFESGASAIYSTGGLDVLGTSSASTTMQNQGSGTYGLTLGGTASTSLSYYEIRDINSSGLVFAGTPSVYTLSYGDFEITQSGGSGITVGGTAIDVNPAKNFTDNVFATTTAISAFNVTATGTSVSSWRFTNHSGNIAGEAFDVDPDGDPGYLVWDDSAANITVSGNVYSDEGSTVSGVCDGSTTNIHVRVAGLTSYVSSCNAGTGLYSVNGVTYSPGDSIVVYIDGEASYAANVTTDMVSNIGDMHLYENRVIVRHENTNPIDIADMAVWDSSDDADIPFTAVNSSPDTLTLPANRKLIVWNGKEFAPGGNVTISGGGAGAAYDGTLELFDNGDWTSASGEAHSVGGSLISGTGSVFEVDTSSFTFTTTGSDRTIDTNDGEFANVIFNGSGSWTVTNTILDIDDLTITAGDVTLPTGTTTISGSLQNNGGTFDSNSGIMVFDSAAAENIKAGGSDFAELIISGADTFTMQDTNATATDSVSIDGGTLVLPPGVFSIDGNFRNEGGSVTHNTSELVMVSATSATILASSSDLYSVTIDGTGPFTMEDNSLSLLGSLTVSSGSITLASGTLSIGGSLIATGGTFDNATGTILFNSSDTGETIDSGQNDFYNVNIASALGGWSISSDATTTNNFTLSSASDFTLGSGNDLAVLGVFTNTEGGLATTWAGSTLKLLSGTEYSINTKVAGGDDYETIIVGANTDISSWSSQATTTTMNTDASLYSQDNAAVDGSLYIYGDYHISTTTEYWSYATDFDGSALGGSPRAVTVAIASSATTSVDGGTLNIIGTSGNETTITNQGSGTYEFEVSSGTYNAQYYKYRNLNINGLSLINAPVITSLDYGDFELVVDGGNLISLSSTTLNANASLVITGARFATTTAITGDNVDLSGTTPSAWTFVGETGNLSGEAFDVDGGALCGSIRWDDSSCLITQQTHYRWRNDDGGIDVPDSEWFNASWTARQRVRVENTDNTTYTDVVVELTIVHDSDMQSDFDDLRFTDSSGTTTIPYFIASSTSGTLAEVWVKIPNLAALDTTNVFMYYKNGSATAVSSSTETFISADDFEDNNISEYSGDTSIFAVDGTYAYGGSYGLDNTGDESSRATDGIARFDQTVSQGEIIRYMQYVNTGAGAADEVCTLFGVQSPVTNNTNYAVCLEQVSGTDRISISEDVSDVDSSGTILSSSTVTYSTGWYEVEIDWQTDDTIDVTLYKDNSVIATTSASDSSKTSGGFGFTYWFNNGGWDNFTSRARVDTEPTILFGAEQVDGGATWAADIDSTATEFTVGETARVRFAIENTGLTVTDAYRLEYAEQGASPSCEAVDPSSFATVEPVSSCGSDPVCMEASPNVANGVNTTDLLDGPEIDFITGKFVEDPSNTTASLTINQNEYTELEFSFATNANISDQNLCFKVTDSGAELDTYLRVAKLNVRFDPSFGAISFNGGLDISLVAGTTTRVYATSTVTDLNGYADIVLASSTMYTTAVGGVCSADNNNCYIGTTTPQCSFTNCAGNSCVLECFADVYYHASSTDNDGSQEWFAFLEVEDNVGGYDFVTSPGIELLTLRALDVDSEIGYGSLAVLDDSGSTNASTTVENIGNDPIDVQIIGADLSDGMTSSIAAGQQIFSTTTFTYSTCTECTTLSTTSINYELDLTKPVSTSPVTDKIYWGIAIPFGTKGNPHSGVNTFYAIGD